MPPRESRPATPRRATPQPAPVGPTRTTRTSNGEGSNGDGSNGSGPTGGGSKGRASDGNASNGNGTSAQKSKDQAKAAKKAASTVATPKRATPIVEQAVASLVEHDTRRTGQQLVPVPRHSHTDPDELDDRRISDVNEWGRSEHMRELARRMYDPVYKHWFRAEWEGLEKIPKGGALLVANHAAAIPSDAPVIMHGIETELERPVYGLADNFFRTLPMIGTLWNRLGGLPAHPDNAYRLLREQDQLVLVFPEGTKGPAKTYDERYQLRRFGRGGFVEIAMRAGVPVVPIAVVGAEESMPTLFRIPSIARALGLPYVPITANMLLAGPLGTVAYFPAKFKLKVLDPVHFDVPPDKDRYSRSRVMDESEAIRDQIQAALYKMLRERRSVWFG